MNVPADAHFAERIRASGAVVRRGRTLTVACAEVYSREGQHVATMQQTLMMLANTPDY